MSSSAARSHPHGATEGYLGPLKALASLSWYLTPSGPSPARSRAGNACLEQLWGKDSTSAGFPVQRQPAGYLGKPVLLGLGFHGLRNFRAHRSTNVPAVYPTSAEIAFSAVLAIRKVSNLRSDKPERGFESHPHRHIAPENRPSEPQEVCSEEGPARLPAVAESEGDAPFLTTRANPILCGTPAPPLDNRQQSVACSAGRAGSSNSRMGSSISLISLDQLRAICADALTVGYNP
jgi:hypothetical protein